MFVPIYHQLVKLWREGLSMTEIGNEFGVTRSVIAGAIGRGRVAGWDFPRRPKPIKKPPSKVLKPKPIKPIKRSHASPKHYPHRPPPPPVYAKPRLLIDLDWGDCRWSVGHMPMPDDRHLFCGHPKYMNTPYCEKHAKISYPRLFGDRRTGTTCW